MSSNQPHRSNHYQALQPSIQPPSNYTNEEHHATYQSAIEQQQPISAYAIVSQKDFAGHEKAPQCKNAQYNRIILHRNIGLTDDNDEPMKGEDNVEPMKEEVADQMMMQYNINNNNQHAETHQRETFLNSQNQNNIDMGSAYQQSQEKQPLPIRMAETFTNFVMNDANRMQSNHLQCNNNKPTENMNTRFN